MTVIDRDEVIQIFEYDTSLSPLNLMAKYGSHFSRNDVETMLNEMKTRIYIKILETTTYEVETREEY